MKILIVDQVHGQYVPLIFVRNLSTTDRKLVSEWRINTILAGPEDDMYWEAWDGILDEFRKDGYRLEHDQDLFLVKEEI